MEDEQGNSRYSRSRKKSIYWRLRYEWLNATSARFASIASSQLMTSGWDQSYQTLHTCLQVAEVMT